jgi:hypothetical protein
VHDGERHTRAVHDREGIAMTMHKSLRERLEGLFAHDVEPRFEASSEPTLAAFAKIFADSGLYAFDANKHLRTDALSPIYDCETESQRRPGAEPELFSVTWAPVWQRDSPVTGFRTGRDSTFIGSTPTIAMPQDERTAALLLLVTTTFVHLSGIVEDGRLVVRGAAEDDEGNYRFLEFIPRLVAHEHETARRREGTSSR